MREPTMDEQIENLLDALLEAVEDADDDDEELPAVAADALAETMLEHGMAIGALTWRTIASQFRDERLSVGEFKARVRKDRARLSRGA